MATRMTAAEVSAKDRELKQKLSDGTLTDAQLRSEVKKMYPDANASEINDLSKAVKTRAARDYGNIRLGAGDSNIGNLVPVGTGEWTQFGENVNARTAFRPFGIADDAVNFAAPAHGATQLSDGTRYAFVAPDPSIGLAGGWHDMKEGEEFGTLNARLRAEASQARVDAMTPPTPSVNGAPPPPSPSPSAEVVTNTPTNIQTGMPVSPTNISTNTPTNMGIGAIGNQGGVNPLNNTQWPVNTGGNNIRLVSATGIPEGSVLPFNEGNRPMGADPSMGSLINPLAFGVSPDLQALGIQDPFGAYTATRSRGVPVYDPTMGSMAGYQSALGMGYQPERGRFFLSPATQGTGSWAEYLANPMRQQSGMQNYAQSFGQLAQMIADPLGFEASNPLVGRFAQFFDPNSVRSDHIAQNLADAALASMGGPRSFNPALRDMFTRRFAAMSMSDPTINRQQSLANYADWLNRGLGGAALSPRTYGSNMYGGTPYVDPTIPTPVSPTAPSVSPSMPFYQSPSASTMFNTDTNPVATLVNQPPTPTVTQQPSQPAGVPLTPEVFSGLPSNEQFGVMQGVGGWLDQFDDATKNALRATGKLDFMNTGVM